MDDVREDVDSGLRVCGPARGRAPGEGADRGVVRVEWDDVERPSFDIVAAVATATGRGAVELPPLYDTVDGDAVEVLLRGDGDTDVRLSFTYAGTSVVVDRGEAIEVRPTTA